MMKNILSVNPVSICVFILGLLVSMNVNADPPYFGTVSVEPNIVVDSDPSTFVSIAYQGTGIRQMFDRRTGMFGNYTVHLFDVVYSDSTDVEVQVNNEFNQAEAEGTATFYATAIGQIPAALKSDVETVWIHRGDYPFGGGNNNILIHTGVYAEYYILDGELAEALIHESTHTSIDAMHTNNASWLAAQESDGEFISEYARDFHDREDLAESLLMYLAVTYRSDRLSAQDKTIIENTIPNRMAYFDILNLDFSILEVVEDDIFKNGFEQKLSLRTAKKPER